MTKNGDMKSIYVYMDWAGLTVSVHLAVLHPIR